MINILNKKFKNFAKTVLSRKRIIADSAKIVKNVLRT